MKVNINFLSILIYSINKFQIISGGPRIELNVPKPMYSPMPMYPPKPMYSPKPMYPMKPSGYGPKKYAAPSYYKLPSTGVPYYETTTKKAPYKSSSSNKLMYAPNENIAETHYHGSSDYDQQQYSYPQDYYGYNHDQYDHSAEYHPYSSPNERETYTQSVQEPQQHVNHRVIYLPADADSESVYQAPPAPPTDYSEYSSSGKLPESSSEPVYDPRTSMYHKISQISSDTNRPIGKDLSVSRHESYGTVINIPAASEHMMTFMKPDTDGYHMMESHRYSQSAAPEIELSKIVTVNKPMFKNLLSKQYEQPRIKQQQSKKTTRTPYEIQIGTMAGTNNLLQMPISTLSLDNMMMSYPSSVEPEYFKNYQFPLDYLNDSPSFDTNEDVQYVLVPINNDLFNTKANY
mgnify:CR=1 FL=1